MNTQIAPVEFVVESDPFAECVSLPNEVVLYIPSTVDVDNVNADVTAEVLAYVSERLAETYGGVTQNAPARGGWKSDTLGMVYEQVTPITCYIADLDNVAKRHLVNLASYIKTTMRQEAVLLVVNGQGLLV